MSIRQRVLFNCKFSVLSFLPCIFVNKNFCINSKVLWVWHCLCAKQWVINMWKCIQGDWTSDRHACRGIQTNRNHIGLQGCKCCSCALWCKKEEKQQHINGPTTKLLKVCTTIVVWNYDQKRRCMIFFICGRFLPAVLRQMALNGRSRKHRSCMKS